MTISIKSHILLVQYNGQFGLSILCVCVCWCTLYRTTLKMFHVLLSLFIFYGFAVWVWLAMFGLTSLALHGIQHRINVKHKYYVLTILFHIHFLEYVFPWMFMCDSIYRLKYFYASHTVCDGKHKITHSLGTLPHLSA